MVFYHTTFLLYTLYTPQSFKYRTLNTPSNPPQIYDMKRLILITLAVLGMALNSYSQVPTPPKPKDPIVRDTTIKAVKYPIYKGSRGGLYILRVSKGTGKEYKQYLKKK